MAIRFRERLFKFLAAVALSRNTAVLLTAAAAVAGIVTYLVLTRHSTNTDTVYTLLNLDLALLLLLGAVVARQVARLWGQRKEGMAGARLHARLVGVFGILAAVPAILMAIFSALFFYFGVHAWFNERVSTAVHESLEVARAYLQEHQQVMRADVLAMANDLNRQAPELLINAALFDRIVETQSALRGLSEAIVVTSSGEVLARAPLSMSLEMEGVSHSALAKAASGDVALMTGGDENRLRALVKLDRFFDSYLYVGRLVDANVLAHMRTAETAVKEYTTLQGRRSQFQIAMTAMFIVAALLLLLAAVWFGLRFSEQLMIPIAALIAATEKVRAGDLSARVPKIVSQDEIGLLATAFNLMTDQLQAQQAELLTVNAMIDERRRFIETVLAGTSSGVVGLDHQGFITLANAGAIDLLGGENVEDMIGKHFTKFMPLDMSFYGTEAPLPQQVEYAVGAGPRRTLLVRITREKGGQGQVVTLDDISALVSAQRKAAWSDVARRIAHEIKNPLTPIQLAAERLRRKYLPQIAEEREIFEKCTDTIIRQVADIGHMVSEFSSYARMPVAVKAIQNFVHTCEQAVVLQQQAHPDLSFTFSSELTEILAHFDRAQMAQVITNLLQNAIDSIYERQHLQPGVGKVKLHVCCTGNHVVLTIEDNGVGLPEKIKDQVFEPYVTTKKKGGGLGLAIVKKIMEDHGGSVVLEEGSQEGEGLYHGVKATVVFPRDVKA